MLLRGHAGLTVTLTAPLVILIGIFYSKIAAIILLGGALAGGGLPDLDTDTKLVKHRGFTHTIWFSIIAGVVGGLIVATMLLMLPEFPLVEFTPQQRIASGMLFGFGIFYGTLTHLAGDVITPRGIRPYDPVSPREILPIEISDKKYKYEIGNAANKRLNNTASLIGVISTSIIAYMLITF